MDSNTTNQRKEIQLGMPFGTACNRLRRQILFSVLQKHGENVCFHCNLSILYLRELSIEHKRPWQDVDPSLFWDMNNIAFSHLKCNVEAARKVGGPNKYTIETTPNPRRVGSEGTSWCADCKDFLPNGSFAKNRHRWNGFQKICKLCRSKRRSPNKHK